jgi:CBS domain-containing protein
VREDRLVGIITEQDFIKIAGNLLDETLGLDGDQEAQPTAPAQADTDDASAS